jgi:HPr kinase/phosphorylase
MIPSEDTIILEEKMLQSSEVDVYSIVKEKRTGFELKPLLNADQSILKEKKIFHPTIIRPHFALTGYFDNFVEDSFVIFGRTEIEFLEKLDDDVRYERLKRLSEFRIPCIFFTNYGEYEINERILEIFSKSGIPVYGFNGKTPILLYRLMDILDDVFCPKASLHGNLVEVFSVGILIIGDSGIGKSELTMELVGKGHLFIADDIIFIMRKFGHKLLGYGNQSARKWIEIRGAGLFDITELFGSSRYKAITEVKNVIFLYSQENLVEKVVSFMRKHKKLERPSSVNVSNDNGIKDNVSNQKLSQKEIDNLLQEYTQIPDSLLIDAEYKIYKRILKYPIISRISTGSYPASILGIGIDINPIEVTRTRDIAIVVEAIANRIHTRKIYEKEVQEPKKEKIKTSTGIYTLPPNYFTED